MIDQSRSKLLFAALGARLADRNHQKGAHLSAMRLEKVGRVVIVEGKTGCAAPEAVRGQVCASSQQPSFNVRSAITSISKDAQNLLQVGHIDDQRAAVCTERLLKTQVTGFSTELARLEELESSGRAAVVIRAG